MAALPRLPRAAPGDGTPCYFQAAVPELPWVADLRVLQSQLSEAGAVGRAKIMGSEAQRRLIYTCIQVFSPPRPRKGD